MQFGPVGLSLLPAPSRLLIYLFKWAPQPKAQPGGLWKRAVVESSPLRSFHPPMSFKTPSPGSLPDSSDGNESLLSILCRPWPGSALQLQLGLSMPSPSHEVATPFPNDSPQPPSTLPGTDVLVQHPPMGLTGPLQGSALGG